MRDAGLEPAHPFRNTSLARAFLANVRAKACVSANFTNRAYCLSLLGAAERTSACLPCLERIR